MWRTCRYHIGEILFYQNSKWTTPQRLLNSLKIWIVYLFQKKIPMAHNLARVSTIKLVPWSIASLQRKWLYLDNKHPSYSLHQKSPYQGGSTSRSHWHDLLPFQQCHLLKIRLSYIVFNNFKKSESSNNNNFP